VGYKNLLPNQKETIKRRTFIKTSKETTTTEEYASSRDADFSSSQKETLDVVTETASQTNYSLSASLGFSFIVSAEMKATTGGDFKEASKNTQNKVSETVMKGSTKYNNKKEVKNP
jgi:hypothetical protein